MGDASPGTPSPARPTEDRLDSWKEIAAYLNRDVTTVQRWEKREGMPVHRHQHDKMGSVYAFRAELHAWSRSRSLAGAEEGADAAEGISTGAQEASRRSALRKWRLVLGLAVAGVVLATGAAWWLERTEFFWRNPLTDARFQKVTDFEGAAQDAAISRDGHLIAFLSDHDGPMDVWVTQVGSGEFHNLTHGSAPELANPLLRALSFSPDNSLVTFWARKREGAGTDSINVWAVPTLGGQPRIYLEGVAEFDWSRDGSRLVYHTPGPGDPMFVTQGSRRPEDRPIFIAPPGLHCHFQLWSPDATFIYFVQGSLADKLDVWRIRPTGGTPERMTSHNARVSHPVLLDRRTLLYLASDADGSGPWLYSADVERRIPHRLSSGLDRYTSLAASADGRRLVLTAANPKRTLWRLRVGDSVAKSSPPERIALTSSSGFSPRLGPNYLVYASEAGAGASVWKFANGTTTELWNGSGARIVGGPAVSSDGQSVAFSVRQNTKTQLYVIKVDGTNGHIVTDSLELQGDPAWTPDGKTIMVAAEEHRVPHLFRLPVDGQASASAGAAASFLQDYSVDPAWAPDGRFMVYSGPDIGTTFSVKAVTAAAASLPLPALTLTRGARHMVVLAGGQGLVVLRGEIEHKNLSLIDLQTGAERQLTNVPADFNIRDFDISPDGREVVLEREQQQSDVVMLSLPHR